MKRKDDAEEKKQIEKDQQKSIERTHWTLKDEEDIEENGNDGNGNNKLKPKYIIEYDNTGGIQGNYVGIGRQSFKNFNKKEKEIETETKNTTGGGPMNKIPKLIEQKEKKK